MFCFKNRFVQYRYVEIIITLILLINVLNTQGQPIETEKMNMKSLAIEIINWNLDDDKIIEYCEGKRYWTEIETLIEGGFPKFS